MANCLSEAIREEWEERDIWTDWEFAGLLCGENSRDNMTLITMGIGRDYRGLRIPIPNLPPDTFFIPEVNAVSRVPIGFTEEWLQHLTLHGMLAATNLDYIRRAIIAEALAAKKIDPEPTGTNPNLSPRYYLKPSACVRWWRRSRKRRMHGSKTWEVLAKQVEAVSTTTKPKRLRPSQLHKARCREIATDMWAKGKKENKLLTSANSLALRRIFIDEGCDGKRYEPGTIARWIGPVKPKKHPI